MAKKDNDPNYNPFLDPTYRDFVKLIRNIKDQDENIKVEETDALRSVIEKEFEELLSEEKDSEDYKIDITCPMCWVRKNFSLKYFKAGQVGNKICDPCMKVTLFVNITNK